MALRMEHVTHNFYFGPVVSADGSKVRLISVNLIQISPLRRLPIRFPHKGEIIRRSLVQTFHNGAWKGRTLPQQPRHAETPRGAFFHPVKMGVAN